MKAYKVFYKKNTRFDTGKCIEDFKNQYVLVMMIIANDLEEVYRLMQGENWSPNGEARKYLENLGVNHTSMSVGDIVQEIGSLKTFVVDTVGFTEWINL